MTLLDTELRSIGIDPAREFRRQQPRARRADGWSALGSYQPEVDERLRLFKELTDRGLVPTDLSDKNLLDFGCGLAPSALALAPQLNLAVGVDSSIAHCISAAECTTHLALVNMAVLHGSLPSCPEFPTIPFQAGSFDLIISYHGCWRHDLPRLMPDWAELLRAHGYLYLVYPRFWFSTDQLNPDEQVLRTLMEREVREWAAVSMQSLTQSAALFRLQVTYRGPLEALPEQIATGIVCVSSGIVQDREEYAQLIGDFTRRWRISQEIAVLQKR